MIRKASAMSDRPLLNPSLNVLSDYINVALLSFDWVHPVGIAGHFSSLPAIEICDGVLLNSVNVRS
jgi:hypothetical protein